MNFNRIALGAQVTLSMAAVIALGQKWPTPIIITLFAGWAISWAAPFVRIYVNNKAGSQ
ncbi:hypothetical protein [Corynebacterium aquilae]|uniref:hypothetical protein n=1 Tax=Corynebacterium aquilae TaxID=203263 RepID=UPI0012EEACE8|nr:hypothetical protein [Corynebacterium aquilae]